MTTCRTALGRRSQPGWRWLPRRVTVRRTWLPVGAFGSRRGAPRDTASVVKHLAAQNLDPPLVTPPTPSSSNPLRRSS